MALGSDIRSLFLLRESPVRWPIAVQAAVAIGLPTLGFAIAGQPALGLLASSGAFTALYLAGRSRRQRAISLPFIAAGLILASAIGVVSSGSLALSLAAIAAVAIVAAILCLGFSAGPPGGLFFVLVAGVGSHLAGPPSLGGAGLDGGLVVGMLAIGCAIAYLVVLSPLLLASRRRADATLHEMRQPFHFALDDISRIIVTRIAIGAVIAALLSAPLGIHRAYWVVLTVVVILQNGHRIRLTALRAIHRVLGTLFGVGVFALIALADPRGIVLALVLMALQFTVELIVIRNYGLALVLITPLALTISAQSGDVGATVADRVVDTVLGAAIAVIVLIAALLARRVRPGALPGA